MIDDIPEFAIHTPPGSMPIDDVTRSLPHALGPEKSVLSAMLQYPDTMMGLAVELGLTEGHFYMPAHATLFGVLVGLSERSEEIELVSLVQHLLDLGMLDRVGGPANVTDLYTYSPSPGHFRTHVQMVKDKHILRSIIQNSNEAIAQAYDAPAEVAELLDSVEAKFLSIRNTTNSGSEVTTAATINEMLDIMQRTIAGDDGVTGMSTGYAGMDALRCHLKPGEMFVIAARPSMGKTSLMMNFVEKLAVDSGKAVMVFSLEMTRLQLITRMAYSRARINGNLVVPGWTPDKGTLQRMQRASLEIAKARLFINDTPGLAIGQLRAIARRKHKEVGGLDLIAIDYVQMMKSLTKQAQGSREREIAEISSGVKNLAKELGVPIILLAQLNRGPEQRTGKSLGIPRMSDLRESGALEQDADMVGLLYRKAYYCDNDEDKAAAEGRADLNLAKNRNGPVGSVPLTFVAELMRFEDGAPARDNDLFNNPPEPSSRYV